MALKITNTAATHLLSLIKTNNCRFVRFGAMGGGCNGFRYTLTPIKEPEPNSTVVSLDGVHGVELCQLSEFYLFGTEIGWEEDAMGARYVFHTPMASTCGCGSTFSPSPQTK